MDSLSHLTTSELIRFLLCKADTLPASTLTAVEKLEKAEMLIIDMQEFMNKILSEEDELVALRDYHEAMLSWLDG
jgi:isochorismate hydrolase